MVYLMVNTQSRRSRRSNSTRICQRRIRMQLICTKMVLNHRCSSHLLARDMRNSRLVNSKMHWSISTISLIRLTKLRELKREQTLLISITLNLNSDMNVPHAMESSTCPRRQTRSNSTSLAQSNRTWMSSQKRLTCKPVWTDTLPQRMCIWTAQHVEIRNCSQRQSGSSISQRFWLSVFRDSPLQDGYQRRSTLH